MSSTDSIRKFNRFELKYILTIDQVAKLKKDLLQYVVPDAYAKDGKYTLSSLYYDTPDYRSYYEKVEGLKFRRKLRIRRYVSDEAFDDESRVYLEIKQRVDRVTQKRRVPMKYGDAKRLIHEEIIPEHDASDTPVIEEILAMVREQDLRRAAITTYDREAFFGTQHDLGLRITFDTFVSYKTEHLELEDAHPEGYMLSPELSILEVKANEKIPYWITELVASHGIRLIRISKYCQAIEIGALGNRHMLTG